MPSLTYNNTLIKSVSKILITKPALQAQVLLNQLQHIGLAGFSFPSIDIFPPKNPDPMQSIATTIDQVDMAIFNSVNAVNAAIPLWKTSPQAIAAIGPATAAAIEGLGYNVDIVANPPCSESLLQQPALQSIDNKSIAIFCGEDPKPLLHRSLKAQGANVATIYCYQRRCPEVSVEKLQQLLAEDIHCITTCSPDSLINLYRLLTPKHLAWLLGKPLIVINDKMLTLAMKMGFLKRHIYCAENASNAAVIKTIDHVMQLNP